MEVPQNLEKMFNADENGIIILNGRQLMNIPDYTIFQKPGENHTNQNPLPYIINVLGERSSKVGLINFRLNNYLPSLLLFQEFQELNKKYT